MKKAILSILIALACQASWAQSAHSLYRAFKNIKGVENVFIPRLVVAGTRLIGDIDTETRMILNHIHSIRIMNLEECNDDVRKNFLKKAETLNTTGYHELISARGERERTLVMLKMKDERVKEVVVLDAEPKECSMVIIKCNITPEMVNKLVDIAGKGNINTKPKK